jgi:hypothetical protein
MDVPTYLASTDEKSFQRTVVDAAMTLGWICVHFPNAIINPTGWPDLILIGHRRVLFRELKTDRGKVSRFQQEWIDKLSAAGADVAVWRPSDWQNITLDLQTD